MNRENLFVKVIYPALILSAHVGLLGLLIENRGNIWFFSHYHTEILLSAFILLIAYTASFRLFSTTNKRSSSVLAFAMLLTMVNVLFLLSAFFVQGPLRYFISLTLLFLGIILVTTFCGSGKTKALLNLKRISMGAVVSVWLVLFGINLFPYLGLSEPPPPINEIELKPQRNVISTGFYDVELVKYHLPETRKYHAKILNILKYAGWAPRVELPLGHISALDNKNFLLAAFDGNLYQLTLRREANGGGRDEYLHIRNLFVATPINYNEFISSEASKKIPNNRFRVTDSYIGVEKGERTLYIGHHFWNDEKKCFTLRISKWVGSVSALLKDNPPVTQWHTLYETTPCFPMRTHPLRSFAGHQSGGRIVGLDENTLLFSVGDHAFDGTARSEPFPQDKDTSNSYGKIWAINRSTGKADRVSLGHRNPQGLYRAPDGSIWETEHGPRGGDELNRIKAGKNYGWPYALYGTGYGRLNWSMATKQNSHEGYEQPIFAWLPSIGVSNLIGVEQDLFPLWKSNLLVSSLKSQTLFRLQMNNGRVIYSESISDLGGKIRDLTEAPNGEIFMWLDEKGLLQLRPANTATRKNETLAEAGERLFFKCAGCHGTEPTPPHGEGPNLYNIYNNPIARHDEYAYSPALRAKSEQRWTEENLSLYLQDPQAFAPGTTMQMNVPDSYERRALIWYLQIN